MTADVKSCRATVCKFTFRKLPKAEAALALFVEFVKGGAQILASVSQTPLTRLVVTIPTACTQFVLPFTVILHLIIISAPTHFSL